MQTGEGKSSGIRKAFCAEIFSCFHHESITVCGKAPKNTFRKVLTIRKAAAVSLGNNGTAVYMLCSKVLERQVNFIFNVRLEEIDKIWHKQEKNDLLRYLRT